MGEEQDGSGILLLALREIDCATRARLEAYSRLRRAEWQRYHDRATEPVTTAELRTYLERLHHRNRLLAQDGWTKHLTIRVMPARRLSGARTVAELRSVLIAHYRRRVGMRAVTVIDAPQQELSVSQSRPISASRRPSL